MYGDQVIPNSQYEYDYGPDGPLASLQARSAHPDHPSMIAPPIGWVQLVVDLDKELASILPDYTIAQVKEKFAGLRYYIDTYGVGREDPRVAMANDLIREAEDRSRSICQICGSAGSLSVISYWHATLCDEHDGVV